MKPLVVALLLLAVGGVATNSEPRPLTGDFVFKGRTPVDPPPDEPQNTHMSIRLTGESARSLFENMNVPITANPCDPDSTALQKRIGATTCQRDQDVYKCWFAINVQHQRIEASVAC